MDRLAFVLGREPHLSVAELFAVLGDTVRWEDAEVSAEAMMAPVVAASFSSPSERGTNSDRGDPFDSQTRSGQALRVAATALMSRLAGTIKIAEALPASSPRPSVAEGEGGFSSLTHAIGHLILAHTDASKRVRFGYSVYDLGGGAKEVQRVRAALTRGAKAQKAWLEEQGRKVRHVTSRDATLSSVTVERQGLLPEDNGVEVCVLVGNPPTSLERLLQNRPRPWSDLQHHDSRGRAVITLARTLAVQPFQEWSKRDYGRPRRDARSGMLPPKLARAMCNIALGRNSKNQIPNSKQSLQNIEARNTDETAHAIRHSTLDIDSSFVIRPSTFSLLDPFCGSGTVLTEALLLGVPHIIGTDVSETAVRDARENMEWVGRASRESRISPPKADPPQAENLSAKSGCASGAKSQIFQCDVRQLSRCVREKVDVIVTEPYLGPPLSSAVGAGPRPRPSGGRPRGVAPTRNRIEDITHELRALYIAAFREFAKVVKSGGRIVFIVPDYRLPTTDHRPPNFDITPDVAPLGFTRVNPFPPALRSHPVLRGRDDLPYARADQRVGRRILLFTYQPQS